MVKRPAKAQQVFSHQPTGIISEAVTVGVPETGSRILRVNVDWNQGVESIAARNQSGRRYSRQLRERRIVDPLPPISQPAKMKVVGDVRREIGSQSRHEITRLARD